MHPAVAKTKEVVHALREAAYSSPPGWDSLPSSEDAFRKLIDTTAHWWEGLKLEYRKLVGLFQLSHGLAGAYWPKDVLGPLPRHLEHLGAVSFGSRLVIGGPVFDVEGWAFEPVEAGAVWTEFKEGGAFDVSLGEWPKLARVVHEARRAAIARALMLCEYVEDRIVALDGGIPTIRLLNHPDDDRGSVEVCVGKHYCRKQQLIRGCWLLLQEFISKRGYASGVQRGTKRRLVEDVPELRAHISGDGNVRGNTMNYKMDSEVLARVVPFAES